MPNTKAYTVANNGLTLIKTQTIGSAVSAVTVTGAFSATYDNYLIIVAGGTGSTTANSVVTLGSTTSGYYYAGPYMVYSSGTVSGFAQSNVSGWNWTYYTSAAHSGRIYLQSPFLAKNTTGQANLVQTGSGGFVANYHGFLDNTISYTAFTITASSGTLTGGTIRVYGYKNS